MATKRRWTIVAVATALVSFLVPVGAQAISRYDPTTMSCSAIQALIQEEGAVILRWIQPPNILRFDRFVAGNQYCGTEERATPSTVPSADGTECQVYACKHFDPSDLFWFDGFSGPFPGPGVR
jgi:hypothetical protein